MCTTDGIAKPLAAWATAFYGENTQVSNLNRLSGGASQETWAFDIRRPDGNLRPLILRRVPGGEVRARNSSAITLATEARLLQLVAPHAVPVPEVKDVFDPDSEIGESFVMERVAGETIARKILRDDTFSTARENLTHQAGAALARIHAAPADDLPELPTSNGMDQLQHYETVFREFGIVRPVFELALRWLKENAPKARDPVLVHGDFRLGNLIVDSGGLAAVLDWELAHIGDPREDLAWICVNSWRFGNRTKRVGGFGELPELLGAYAEVSGVQFDVSEIDWWETLGSLKWGIMCMIMYEAFRSGADRSVERAAIGRRVSETEIDLLNLLEGV